MKKRDREFHTQEQAELRHYYPGNQDPHKSLQPIRSSNSRSRLPGDQRSTTESTEIHGKENPNQLPLSVSFPGATPARRVGSFRGYPFVMIFGYPFVMNFLAGIIMSKSLLTPFRAFRGSHPRLHVFRGSVLSFRGLWLGRHELGECGFEGGATQVEANDLAIGIDEVGRGDRADAESVDEVGAGSAVVELKPG